MVALPKIKQQDKIECLGRHSPTSSKGKHNERHEHGTDGRRADSQTRGWIIRKEDLTIIATRKKTHFFFQQYLQQQQQHLQPNPSTVDDDSPNNYVHAGVRRHHQQSPCSPRIERAEAVMPLRPKKGHKRRQQIVGGGGSGWPVFWSVSNDQGWGTIETD